MAKDRAVHDAVAAAVADQVAAGRHLGVQVAAWFEGELIVDVAAGWLDPARTRPVAKDSLFSLFSVTKALAALALWRLVARGELDLDTRQGAATVEQLLSHQAGLHRVPADIDTAFLSDLDKGLAWLATQQPAWPPGDAAGYHTLSHGWITEGLSRWATGKTLAQLVQDEVVTPLGLDGHVSLGLTADDRAATIVELAEARGLAWIGDAASHPAREAFPPTFVPDWNDPRLRRCGHGAFGGWASARALAEVFARVDELVGLDTRTCVTRLVSDAVDVCLELPVRRGTGVELGGADLDGIVGSLGPRATAFGHGGHGGQVAVADPDVGLSIVVLANLLPSPEEASDRTTPICELIRALLGVAI